MNDFFTWGSLGTYAGAVLCTTLVTQLLKGIGFIDRIPTRIFSYVVAAAVLILAHIFTGQASLSGLMLCLVNGVVVSLASNGTYDMVRCGRDGGA